MLVSKTRIIGAITSVSVYLWFGLTTRFGYIYADSYSYISQIMVFRGNDPIISYPHYPFSFRVLVPLLSAPLPFPPEIAMSIVNIFFLAGYALIIYEICFAVTSDAISSTIAALIPSFLVTTTFYSLVPLSDMSGMFFVVLGTYIIVTERSDKTLLGAVLVGALARETVIVVLFFYFLYRPSIKSFFMPFLAVNITMLYRTIFFGTYSQPLTLVFFELGYNHFQTVFIQALLPVLLPVILLYFTWLMMHEVTPSRRFYLLGLVSVLPILILGMFFAHFDPRFVWPLHIFLVPLTAIGLSSARRLTRHRPLLSTLDVIP